MIRSAFIFATLTALPAMALAQAPAPAEERAPVAAPAAAAKLKLKADLTLSRDIVGFGDLIAGLSPQDAALPAFRAPALGDTGTIQVARIVDAAVKHGILRDAQDLDSQGVAQVVVSRAARRITGLDVEAAVKSALLERFGFDGRAFALQLDGGAPSVVVEPELTGDLAALDLNYDARTRRVTGRLTMPGSAATRLKPVRVSGQLVETAEVVVPLRTIARGETLKPSDVTVERRPRDAQFNDVLGEMKAAIGKVAKRTLMAGSVLRSGDVQREEVVGRGDIVTIVYEARGIAISMRGRASEAGAVGDSIAVTNIQSKRVLQGTVTGPGRVNVSPHGGGQIAAAR
ncbi:Flagella basal body P-ring formation protein FlgA [Bosea sp. 62]|uniref:flagellar basal body P-ring formation chaperone FlgA n=1 Tax=unclassified Bosea (in: a-proteobacteria) TaxID=2653178 RepID=UPI0012519931|nr:MULTISPECIES: flagellar basal body P-ring formation chaperone FlgA [unclassified Bosea (in: a-proteobacteria)]CAD5267367.1 Flagella basal body P-ring formation protein FlgA [Bosea sp. 46]CAD5269182.1 Flagella basal body P-ring formation protein FlgA [Bosea sp. 21B]CAD5269449.1 Flagella basal body P-ring formation protein FlgA [Bosea sp. 7B]VVT62494.1 Flagella basal body P-ring formation protein FlgA [Bosea sp. EC-HK365B]VXB95240.1 Flagella basal body P-ring formation protein FlgA [Bosea sp.